MIISSALCPFCRISSADNLSPDLKRCGKCGLVFNINHKSLSYDRDYFISEYQSQYGKTYIEDYKNIYSVSKSRIRNILKLIRISSTELSALDIGSAAGFFLKAAADSGVESVQGLEISEFAAEYCRNVLGIDVICSPFEKAEINEKFDIITSWFFIEHLADPLAAIERIYTMLKDGGVYALAVPSSFGPMYFFDRSGWIKTHPKDHRIDLTPKSAKRILKRAGFSKVKISICGYHPERVIKRESLFFRPFEFLYRIFSRLTGFSDTIEIYAVK